MFNRESKNPFFMKFETFGNSNKIITEYGKQIPKWFRPDLKNLTLLRHILYRRHIQMNTFVAVVGDVRTGKSYFSLRIAEELSRLEKKKFDVKKQCSFDILHFLKWSNSNTNSVYVLDEVQTSMSPREWYDIQHKIFNEFCDIQGFRKNILLMPFPNISFIDKHLRFLINYVVRTMSQGRVKWYKVVTQPELGKNWLDFMGVYRYQLPSRNTIEYYESLKKKFCDTKLTDVIETLENRNEPDYAEQQRTILRDLRIKRMQQGIKLREQRINTLQPQKKRNNLPDLVV